MSTFRNSLKILRNICALFVGAWFLLMLSNDLTAPTYHGPIGAGGKALLPARLELVDMGIASTADVAATAVAERLRVSPRPPAAGAHGQPVRLERRGKYGHWEALGDGVQGVLGASFQTTDDGQTLWSARMGRPVLECWDLGRGTHQDVQLEHPATLVAIDPTDAQRVAYSTSDARGDSLWLHAGGQEALIYPLPGSPAPAALGFEWAEDGNSLVLDWAEASPKGGPGVHVIWLRTNGTVGLNRIVPGTLETFAPAWTQPPAAKGLAGLTLGNDGWLWRDGMSSAEQLPGVVGVWGFAPDGKAVAGLADGHLYIQRLGGRHQRFNQAIAQLPPAFEGDPAGFRWTQDEAFEHLKFTGAVPAADGQPPTHVTISLRLRHHAPAVWQPRQSFPHQAPHG